MVLNVFAAKQSFLRYIIIILYWIMLITYLPSFKDMRIKFSPRLLFTLGIELGSRFFTCRTRLSYT